MAKIVTSETKKDFDNQHEQERSKLLLQSQLNNLTGGAIPKKTDPNFSKIQEITKKLSEFSNNDNIVKASSLKKFNQPNDANKLREIKESMQKNGWQGRPLLVWRNGKIQQALTGSHRLAAAQHVGVDVPVVYVDEKTPKWSDDRGRFDTFKKTVNEGEDRIEAFFRNAGDSRASNLMREEFAQATTPGTSSKTELKNALKNNKVSE